MAIQLINKIDSETSYGIKSSHSRTVYVTSRWHTFRYTFSTRANALRFFNTAHNPIDNWNIEYQLVGESTVKNCPIDWPLSYSGESMRSVGND